MIKRMLLAAALVAVLAPAVEAQNVFTYSPAQRRAWLGFSYERHEERQPGQLTLTLRVTSVVDPSPAHTAGLRQGDAILRINGLNATEQLLGTLGSSMTPGDTVTFRVRRDGREQNVRIVAAEPPPNQRGLARGEWQDMMRDAERYLQIYIDSAAAGAAPIYLRSLARGDSVLRQFMRDSVGGQVRIWRDTSFIGSDSSRIRIFSRLHADSMLLHHDTAFFRPFTFEFQADELPGREIFVRSALAGHRAIAGAELQQLNPELARYFAVEAGVLVLNVPENTPARRAGLQAGDVITAVAGTQVRGVAQLRRAIEAAPGSSVRIEYVRERQRRTLELKK